MALHSIITNKMTIASTLLSLSFSNTDKKFSCNILTLQRRIEMKHDEHKYKHWETRTI